MKYKNAIAIAHVVAEMGHLHFLINSFSALSNTLVCQLETVELYRWELYKTNGSIYHSFQEAANAPF